MIRKERTQSAVSNWASNTFPSFRQMRFPYLDQPSGFISAINNMYADAGDANMHYETNQVLHSMRVTLGLGWSLNEVTPAELSGTAIYRFWKWRRIVAIYIPTLLYYERGASNVNTNTITEEDQPTAVCTKCVGFNLYLSEPLESNHLSSVELKPVVLVSEDRTRLWCWLKMVSHDSIPHMNGNQCFIYIL